LMVSKTHFDTCLPMLGMSWHDMSSETANFLSWRDMSRNVVTCRECRDI
jgi:hypothetical protein